MDTVGDCVGCLRGIAAFALLLLAPGYCLAWISNLCEFRTRNTAERLAWAVALSFAVMTIASVEFAKLAALSTVCRLAVLCGLAAGAIRVAELWRKPRSAEAGNGIDGWRATAIAAWCVFVIAELVDIGLGNRLYQSVTIFDHALRTAFVGAVLRTGVPPANPLYWPGHAAPMRYYYFWYVLTAVAARLGAATARQALIASTVWSGLGLAAVLLLYSQHFLPARSQEEGASRKPAVRWPRPVLALALLAVTGLDILPAIAKFLFHLPADADMEWWSPDQVTSWLDSLLWVPHHIAGLVCCLFGFLLVWLSRARSVGQRVLCSLFAGLAFASAFGLSTWIALAFAMLMLLWIASALAWEKHSRARIPALLGACVVAVLALTPYLHELGAAAAPAPRAAVATAPASIGGNASHLLRFGVRHMIDSASLLTIPWFTQLAASHPRREDALAGLILLLPGYFVELGFFGFVLVLALVRARRSQLHEADRTLLTLALAGLAIASFLRSTVISNNDFGIRSILIAQFFLLLLALRWLEGALGATNKVLRIVMLTTLWIGVAGSLYQPIGLRLYLPVEEHLGRPDYAGLSERAMAWRTGFDAMDHEIPADAVIQYDTTQPSDFFRYAQLISARRQVVTAFPDCNSSFGGDSSACPAVLAGVGLLYHSSPSVTAAEAGAECAELGITHAVATRWDPVWNERASWVWTLPPVVDTGDLRVLSCNVPAP